MDLFNQGQKITLIIEKDTRLVEMICSVDKVFDDRLELLLPQYFMRYIKYLQVGCPLTAKAFSKLGTVDFNSIVISSPLEDAFVIELDMNSLELVEDSKHPVIKAIENLDIAMGKSAIRVKTFEISTEYLKFYSDRNFELEDVLECTLILPKDYGIINFRASISDIDSVYTNEYTAMYLTLNDTDRQALLYYMYLYSTDSD